jgi:membrane fusion protein, copper/silver efflux system
MKKKARLIVLLLIIAGSFIAGYWVNHKSGTGGVAVRKVLYYVDPMNPAMKSDKPGIAPCGMPLEPVYADQDNLSVVGTDRQASLSPGAIRISPEKQQLIGVKVATVTKAPWSYTLRVLGRVVPDESLIYRINAAVNGWIEDVSPVTTGSQVKKNDLLATFYSLEYRSLLQNYFNLVKAGSAIPAGGKADDQTARLSASQLKQMRDTIRSAGQAADGSQADYYKKNLYNYGIGEYQLEEMERTRKVPDAIDIRAPIAGFILYRNVFPGFRFDRGVEFFRIADLSRVWILADIFENEASFFRPGMRVKIELPYVKKTLYAQVSPVLPQFDPATRTLKVRLVADNPGFALRPDMFVNVEFPLQGPPAIIVPVDAVLDSGLKKIVFVDQGNGFFESRPVETGRSLGERVEIVRGLMPDEKIVVSGNFLIDSEARMQQAGTPINVKTGSDPVCRMNVDENRAQAEGNVRVYKGKTYYFCSSQCRDEFDQQPKRYLKSTSAPGSKPLPKAPVAGQAESPSRNAAIMQDIHDHEAMPGSQTATPMPMTHDHGTMTMPDTQSTTPLPPARIRRIGRGAKEVIIDSQPLPAPQNNKAMPGSMPMPASPGMVFPPATLPTVPGSIPLPGAGIQKATGSRGPETLPGPGGNLPVPGPGNPGLSGPGGVPGGPIAPGSPLPVP